MQQRRLNRLEKIAFIKSYASGKQNSVPDLSKLTDDELRFIVQVQDKYAANKDLSASEWSEIERINKKLSL